MGRGLGQEREGEIRLATKKEHVLVGLKRQIGKVCATKKEDRRKELIKLAATDWEVRCDKKGAFF